MPEYERDTRRLPAARLSPTEFRQIGRALRVYDDDPNGRISWDFFRGKRNHSAETLEEVLSEVEDKKGINEFEIVAEDEASRITVAGDDDGCFLAYETAEPSLARTLEIVRNIQGIFDEHRRLTNRLPNWIAPWRRPALLVGQPTYTIHLSRDEIIQGIVTRWISNVLTALTVGPISYGFGFLTAWLIYR